MNMDFNFSVDSLELDQAFLLTISVILTMEFTDNINPSTNFAIFYYHALFYSFWIIFLYIIAENLSKTNNIYSEKANTLYQIIKNNDKTKNLIIIFGKSGLDKDFIQIWIKKMKAIQNKVIVITFEISAFIDNYPDVFFYKIDVLGKKDPLFLEMDRFNSVQFIVLSDISKKNKENIDYKSVLMASALRNHCPKALISCQMLKDDFIFLEWADWDFGISTNAFRINLMAKSLLNPGFSILFSNLIKSHNKISSI